METQKRPSTENMEFEAALDRVGFGLYGYMLICWTGIAIISFVCVGFGATLIVPTSACELGTTSGQQGMLAAGPVVGSMLGGIVWGYLADTRGRRKMLLFSLAGGAVVNSLASLSVNWIMLLIMQFIAAISASGLYSMSMSLLCECVPMAKRNVVVLLVSSIFLLSQGLMALLAIPVIPLTFSIPLPALGIYFNSWRLLMIIFSIPGIITAVWLYFMKESPKFLYTKGEEERALEILRVIHRVNNFRSKEELQVTSLVKAERLDATKTTGSVMDQIVPLFKLPLVKYTIIMTLLLMFQQIGAFQVWLPTIADRFVEITQTGEGTDLNMCAILDLQLDMPPDPDAVPCALNESSLLLVLAVGALQSFCNIIFSTIVNKVGRRNMVMLITSVCGVSGILVNLVPNAIGSAVLFVVMLMGTVVLGFYTAFLVSLFPTHLRVFAMAMIITGGRIATFASIQIFNLLLEVNCDAGFYLYASLFASSAIIASFLPDDRPQSPAASKPSLSTDKIQDSNEHTKDISEKTI